MEEFPALSNQTLNLTLQLFCQDNVGNEVLLVDDMDGFVTGWAGPIMIEWTSLKTGVPLALIPTTLQCTVPLPVPEIVSTLFQIFKIISGSVEVPDTLTSTGIEVKF